MNSLGNNREHPPLWADALLRSLLRPADRESISGDLLEEYRAAKRPRLGALRANAWYIKHVASVLWRLVRPSALLLAGLTLVSLMSNGIGLWYGSLLPAPGLSLVHALIYLWAGYHGTRRTRLIRTGTLTAGITSIVGFVAFFGGVAAAMPGLAIAPFSNPFVLVILSVYLLLSLGYGVLVGTLAGFMGRWVAPTGHQTPVGNA